MELPVLRRSTLPAGKPCPNLREDFRCRIHEQLAERGFPGCVVFDCFGAGQRLVHHPLGVLGGQVLPAEQGRGFATEAARRVVEAAFAAGEPELFVVARPANGPGRAVAQRLGFQWVGETTKYYDLRLQVYRLRPADLTPTR